MTWIAAAIGGFGAWAGTAGGAAVIGSVIGAGGALAAANTVADANKEAAKTQSDATNSANNLQKTIYDQQRQDLEPWRQSGVGALNQLNALANDNHQFGMGDFQADPGYAFRLGEGMKALERSASARGGLLSGGTLRAIQRYGQDMGSQEYNNAFNRYRLQRGDRINQLQSLAGIGQTATQQIGNAGDNYANNSGNLIISNANALAQGNMGVANARASGYMGTANTLNNALGSYVNYNQNQAILNKLYPSTDSNTGGYYAPTQQYGQKYIEPFEF